MVIGEPAELPLTPPGRTTERPRGSSCEGDNDAPSCRRRPTHLRLSKSEGTNKSPSNQLTKTNLQFHKLFKEVSREEALAQSYTCALQRDILYQGKMFVSPNWICFHSKVFGRDTKHVFVSFLSRNTTYKFLRSICIHLEVEKTISSHAASCENNFGEERLPLDFARSFSDLDGVARRETEVESSSSSGSQTPDCDKMAAFLSREVSVLAEVHLRPGQKSRAKNGASDSIVAATNADKAWPRATSLPVLLIYLVLVGILALSSCYMAFKMAALEHRLNAVLRAHGGYKDHEELF
ncbi:GRAM domain-containing protein 2B-like isoform X3 [Corythoichthys intestinalis]|uniref:GRAM domain-containing protein 2B-like isoform X3 n=1 Tax=Corythoichthys intestinalis TaxID=161448 RepID=UPI0025A5C9FE|nr:GRAM domain-containing protein 2B-like isoform X3 [Corythoichthys intestinalis]